MPAERAYRLTRPRLLALLEKLSLAGGTARSLYFKPGRTAAEIETRLVADLPPHGPAEAAESIAHSLTGAVLFWGEAHRYLLLPPFPVTADSARAGFQVAPLRDLILADYTIALVALRLGSYGIGVFQGQRLVASKVGTGLVHARHKKGGSSSGRFARHREKQIEGFYTRVCGHFNDKVTPYLSRLDHLVYSGEARTVNDFRGACPMSRRLAAKTLGYRLNLREPKQASLEAAVEDVYSTRVIHWYQAPD